MVENIDGKPPSDDKGIFNKPAVDWDDPGTATPIQDVKKVAAGIGGIEKVFFNDEPIIDHVCVFPVPNDQAVWFTCKVCGREVNKDELMLGRNS